MHSHTHTHTHTHHQGFLLINTTVETQECFECESGSYAIDSTMGCGPTRCDARLCIPCPEGASCEAGGAPRWKHFQPVLLELGDTVLPQITLEIPGEPTQYLHCEEGVRRGAKGCLPAQDPPNATSSTGEHVWRYDSDLPGFVLITCPHGHQLINGSDGTFNAVLQKCKPCGANMYIIPGDSQYSPCKPCPNGALCPDGAAFNPVPADSEWVLEAAPTGGLQYRLDLCPPGYALLREAGNPPELDACQRCQKTEYLLNAVRYQENRGNASAVGYSRCRTCSILSVCEGGNNVEAVSGYWRMQLRYLDGFEYIPEKRCNETGKLALYISDKHCKQTGKVVLF